MTLPLVGAVPRAVSEQAKFLNIHAPSGFENYMRMLAKIRADGQEPPQEFYERNDLYLHS